MSLRRYTACALLALALSGFAAPLSAAKLVPHRALYSLSFGSATGRGNVIDARGTMFFEWLKTCDGWTMEQKLRMQLFDAQGRKIEQISDYSSWESLDGKKFRFKVRNTSDGQVLTELLGRASLGDKGGKGKANYSKPEKKRIELPPGAMFPTAHTQMMIEQAQAGETQFSRVVFDGNDERGAFEINAVIAMAPSPQAKESQTGEANPLLANHTAWHMRLAFYPETSRVPAPEFEVGLKILDNGVAPKLVYDYGDYTIEALLDRVEAVDAPDC
jgi:hypothetical protein